MGLFLAKEAVRPESHGTAITMSSGTVLALCPELTQFLLSLTSKQPVYREQGALRLVLSPDDFPKPQIITQPETTMAVVGKDIRFTCSAASSSSSPMTFAWKKDNEVLTNADMENFAHVRAQDGEVMEYTTILHLRHVTFGHEGRYQCVITNHWSSTLCPLRNEIISLCLMGGAGLVAMSPYKVRCRVSPLLHLH